LRKCDGKSLDQYELNSVDIIAYDIDMAATETTPSIGGQANPQSTVKIQDGGTPLLGIV